MSTLDELLESLWQDYAEINPQAKKIQQLITARGEKVLNDHIAFRTFNIPKVGIDALARAFVQFGYQPKGEYHFKKKKLFARHFEHDDSEKPKVFISELKLEECSSNLQAVAKDLVAQVPESCTKETDFSVCGQPWKKIDSKTYNALKEESEYAAWMAVFGFRANHFTVLFNSLKTFKDLKEFNAFIKENGFKLNDTGGEIKGSPKEYLEQSSTLAPRVEVELADKKEMIPSCYYEFARRYPLPDGKLFQGFVAGSADKIFESTDNK